MATYKKPLKYFDGRTLGGYSFTAEDADGKRLGSYAIDALEAHKTITAEVENKKVLVPFHAVKTAMYGTMTEDAEKADAYCGGGTEPVGELISVVGQFESCCEAFALWVDTVNNFDNYIVTYKHDGSVEQATSALAGGERCVGCGFTVGDESFSLERDTETGLCSIYAINGEYRITDSDKFYRKPRA